MWNFFYCWPNNVRTIESEKVRGISHLLSWRSFSYGLLVGKPEGNGQLGRLKCRYECYVKCDFKTCYRLVLTGYISEYERVACCCEHIYENRFPYYEGNAVTGWATISFARGTLLHSVILSFCIQFWSVPYYNYYYYYY